MDSKKVVIDNGTGYTKMGWAGNPEPTYDIPTCIADYVQPKNQVAVSKMKYDQLDYYIGEAAQDKKQEYAFDYIMKSGMIENWAAMEKFWHRSIFDLLRCEPETTTFVLTEPPLNPPENREAMAEIFFETFNAQAIYIGVQAVLALYSNYMSPINETQKQLGLTGTVLDAGDGVTHVIPVDDGYVIGSCIKHIPLAGRDITKFIASFLKDRNENIPIQDMDRVAKDIKEKYCYLCEGGDTLRELAKYDRKKNQHSKKFKKYEFTSVADKKQYKIDVGYERFLAPEMFFHPEFVDSRWKLGIDEQIDNAIQGSPIDSRRKLYSNIVLSGGSTLYENFPERLQQSVQARADSRLLMAEKASGHKPKPIEVNVAANPYQRFSVWQGGSLLAIDDNFHKTVHTREKYFEVGPSIARTNLIFLS